MPAVQPVIISRAQWQANPLVTPAESIPLPSQELWLHHTAGEQFDETGMRMLQSFTLHRQDEHYQDLEYTFVLDHNDYKIFESRGPGHDSAATYMHNGISHAICVMGNFMIDAVNPQLVEVLANLVAWGYEKGWWPLGFTGGHRDASNNSTACPGNHLETLIGTINARAVQINSGQGSTPTPQPQPVVWKAKPMYNPTLVVPGGIRASLELEGGVLLIGPLGHIFAFGVQNVGGPLDNKGVPKPYWVGHQVASLELPNAVEKAAGKHYTVIDSDNHRYSYPE